MAHAQKSTKTVQGEMIVAPKLRMPVSANQKWHKKTPPVQ
jgi:hypothetical protein